MEDRKPAAMNTFRQHQYPQPEVTHRMYPMQDRTFGRPQDSHHSFLPYGAARTDNSSPEPSPPSSPIPLKKYVDVKSKQKLKPPPVASIHSLRNPSPTVNPARRTSKKISPPKKGPGTHAKVPRRSPRVNQISSAIGSRVRKDLNLAPNVTELGLAKTPRKKQALYTWYRRLNELIEYRERYGHSKSNSHSWLDITIALLIVPFVIALLTCCLSVKPTFLNSTHPITRSESGSTNRYGTSLFNRMCLQRNHAH
jgi:hypothetical protein